MKKFKTATLKIRATFFDGKKEGHWVDAQDCAQKLKLNRVTFGDRMRGKILDEGILQQTHKEMLALLPRNWKPPAKPQPVTITWLFRQGFVHGAWNTTEQCAKTLKVGVQSLKNLISSEKTKHDDPRVQNQHDKIVKRMRNKLKGTDDNERTAKPAPQPTVSVDKTSDVLRVIREELGPMFRPPKKTDPLSQEILRLLFAGTLRISAHEELDLDPETFLQLKGVPTKKQIDQLKKQIGMVRRLLLIIAEIGEEDDRRTVIQSVIPDLEALGDAMLTASAVVPTEFAAERKRDRELRGKVNL